MIGKLPIQSLIDWNNEEKFLQKSWSVIDKMSNEVKEKEKKERHIFQLFIGKVSEEIGPEKTIKLLKESKEAFK